MYDSILNAVFFFIWMSQKKEDLAFANEKNTDEGWEVVGQRSHNKKGHPSVLHNVFALSIDVPIL